jgi:hypothetical protein
MGTSVPLTRQNRQPPTRNNKENICSPPTPLPPYHPPWYFDIAGMGPLEANKTMCIYSYIYIRIYIIYIIYILCYICCCGIGTTLGGVRLSSSVAALLQGWQAEAVSAPEPLYVHRSTKRLLPNLLRQQNEGVPIMSASQLATSNKNVITEHLQTWPT